MCKNCVKKRLNYLKTVMERASSRDCHKDGGVIPKTSIKNAVVHVIMASSRRNGIERLEKYGIIGSSVREVDNEERNSVGRDLILVPLERG
jgi:hypothetical protein